MHPQPASASPTLGMQWVGRTVPDGVRAQLLSFLQHTPPTNLVQRAWWVQVRLVYARYNLIHDCDEVFNFWEPLHYLLYGYGKQTWEYRYSARRTGRRARGN